MMKNLSEEALNGLIEALADALVREGLGEWVNELEKKRRAADREALRKSCDLCPVHRLTLLEGNLPVVTPEQLLPHVTELLERAAKNPATVRLEMQRLFPEGVTLTAPKNARRDPWRADLALDGKNVVFLNVYREQNPMKAQARNAKPPEGSSEGLKFGQLASGSGVVPSHGRPEYFRPPRFCVTDSLNTRGKTPEKTRAPEWA